MDFESQNCAGILKRANRDSLAGKALHFADLRSLVFRWFHSTTDHLSLRSMSTSYTSTLSQTVSTHCSSLPDSHHFRFWSQNSLTEESKTKSWNCSCWRRWQKESEPYYWTPYCSRSQLNPQSHASSEPCLGYLNLSFSDCSVLEFVAHSSSFQALTLISKLSPSPEQLFWISQLVLYIQILGVLKLGRTRFECRCGRSTWA